MKGSMSLSSKMVCRYLVFLVRAVGLTRELMMKSDRWSPKWFMNCFFIQSKCIFLANPSNGLVMMTPLTLSSGLSKSSLMTTSPPMLWPQMKRGRLVLAVLNIMMTSFSSSLTSPQPRTPPEYPKPLKSTSSTSKSFLAQKSAMSLNRVECSPKPWTMQIVYLGFLGVNLVWYRLIWLTSVSIYDLVTVQCSVSNLPRNSSSGIIAQLIILTMMIINETAYGTSINQTSVPQINTNNIKLKRTQRIIYNYWLCQQSMRLFIHLLKQINYISVTTNKINNKQQGINQING